MLNDDKKLFIKDVESNLPFADLFLGLQKMFQPEKIKVLALESKLANFERQPNEFFMNCFSHLNFVLRELKKVNLRYARDGVIESHLCPAAFEPLKIPPKLKWTVTS